MGWGTDPIVDVAGTPAGTATFGANDPIVEIAQPKPDPSAGKQNLYLGGLDTGIEMPEWLSRGLAGAGKAVSDAGRGGMQLGAEALNKVGLVSDSTVQGMRTDSDAIAAQDAPLMNTGAGMVGNVLGNVAMTVLPASGVVRGAEALNAARTANAARTFINPATLTGAAGAGAVQGALQPVGVNDSRTLDTALGAAGGAGGNALAGMVGRVAQPVTNALSDAGSKAVQVLKDAGVPLDAAQQTGSAALNKVRSILGDNPFTAGAQDALKGKQSESFNRAVLNTIGEDAPAATPDVMSAAKTRIGQVFDDVAARNPVPFDNTLQSHLAQIEQDSNGVLNDTQVGPIKKQLDQIVSKAANNGGMIDGAAYQNLKQNLDRLSGGSDSSVGEFARDIRSALDGALQRGTVAAGNQDDYQALLQARQQWGNMRKVEGAIDKEGAGDISPARLANILGQKANRNQSVYGAGNQDLVELAQAGKQLLGDKTPNSGTAGRLITHAIPGAAIGAAEYLHSGDIGDAAKVGAGVYALPKVAQLAINNPAVANYLANGMSQGIGRTLLSAPAENQYVNMLARGAPFALLSGATNGNALKATDEYAPDSNGPLRFTMSGTN